ncbi:MAG: flavodoxin domain-containing protein [Chloroflexota bacterium]
MTIVRVLVISASRLGSTRQIARRIADRLAAAGIDTTTMDAGTADDDVGLPAYDAYVIGSAVYGGHWVASAMDVVRHHRQQLVGRPIWLFSSGPVGETAVRHEAVEPKDVAEIWTSLRPRDHRTFAGALDRSKVEASSLDRVERFVARRFVPEGDYREWEAIDRWADAIAHELATVAPL